MSRDAEFLEYVAAHRGRMVRTARLLAGGDHHWAEDLVQTALTKLYVHWSKVRQAEGVSSYADRILINAFIDERRRFWRSRETSTAELHDPDPSSGPDQADRLTVLDALAQLPRRQRAVVVLRYFQDLDVAATAQVMDCSEGTVKSQTARALVKLRDLVDDPLTTLERVR
jgi:RNA polymerase sigma-70 factor (sigma-E family)